MSPSAVVIAAPWSLRGLRAVLEMACGLRVAGTAIRRAQVVPRRSKEDVDRSGRCCAPESWCDDGGVKYREVPISVAQWQEYRVLLKETIGLVEAKSTICMQLANGG